MKGAMLGLSNGGREGRAESDYLFLLELCVPAGLYRKANRVTWKGGRFAGCFLGWGCIFQWFE